MSWEDLLVLQRHYLRKSAEIAHELALRLNGAGSDESGAAAVIHTDARAPASTAGARVEDDQTSWVATRTTGHGGRRRRIIPTVAAVLERASEPIQRAAEEIINAGFILDGVREPVPERPNSERTARYIRLVWGRKTFAYINVRADHLRIDLPLDRSTAAGLSGNIRIREVQKSNPWKVSLYVSSQSDVEAAIAAIKHVHSLLDEGRI
jgi:hypothetical protein